MKLQISTGEATYIVETDKPIHISIPLSSDLNRQPNAYGAPPYETMPVRDGDFTGAIEMGSPVNFYNLRINPHGNGTHTECVGHIRPGMPTVHECLRDTLCVAELVSVYPQRQEGGDKVIDESQLSEMVRHTAEALIVRTLPNDESKLHRQYTNSNPPYFASETMEWIVGRGYQHLLTDLPSVDREQDEGMLAAHNIFWQTGGELRIHNTITEMIFANNTVEDGLYLLNIQIAAHDLDASPSRPVLFKMKPVE